MLLKKVLAGVLNGNAIAIVTGLGVLVWSKSIDLAFVLGIAMVISMALTGLSGAAIPLVLTRLCQDPAQSASILLTTLTDAVGFLSFLGLATLCSREFEGSMTYSWGEAKARPQECIFPATS